MMGSPALLGVGAALVVGLGVLLGAWLDLFRFRRRLDAGAAREAGLRGLIEACPALLIETDAEGRLVRHAGGDPLDCRPDMPIGTSLLDLVHPDDAAMLREALCGRTTSCRLRCRDGGILSLDAKPRPPQASDGVPQGHAFWFEPARPDAPSSAHEANETFLRGIIENSADCIQVLDLDGLLRFTSRNGLYLMGVEAEAQILGRPFVELWPQAAHGEVQAALAAAGSGAAAHFSARFVTRQGAAKHLDVLVTPIRGTGGDPERLVALSRDTTHLRRAEIAMRESEARYRLLAENASDIIVLQSADHRRSYVSPAVTAVLGYSLDEFAGLATASLVHPDDLAEMMAATGMLDAEGCATSVHRMLDKQGGWVWVEATYRRIAGTAPDAPDIIAVIRDVTERQSQAEELRTAKTMAELAQARAELANQAKTDFLAAMSHEIRTPLNSVIGFADLLAGSGRLAPGDRRQVALIRSASDALLTLLNDILDVSRVEAGAIAIERRAFDVAGLLDATVALVRAGADAKGLTLGIEAASGIAPALFGDEARLRQILLNLLNNAVKFTAAGSVKLRADLLWSAEAAQTLRLSVVDTGPGIAKDKQGRLFKRFSQIDGSVSRTFGGTGLGLAISRQLVELMGGTMGVVSDAGQGATFWFEVTLERAPDPSAETAGPAIPAATRGRTGRLLLVEDIPVNQEVAKAVLEARGHRVDVVGDGLDAIAAVQATPYDLVLMDIQMPGMDGIAATRAIRALAHSASRVPIVATSASVFPEQIRQFRDAGMNDHVGKPFRRDILYSVIDRWIDRRDDTIAPAAEEDPSQPLDRKTYDGLVRLLGKARTATMLEQLSTQIASRFEGDPTEPATRARLKRDAHSMIGAAGIIGFRRLAEACRSLEAAVDDASDFMHHLERLRDEARWSIDKIGDLKAALDEGAEPQDWTDRAARRRD